MTMEEAIRILDPETTGEAISEIEYYGGFTGRTAAVQAVSDACILAVAALREQEQRRWIPVTERLPEFGERVLCTDGVAVFEQYRVELSCVYGMWDRFGMKSPMQEVTHWMPLPEPPKEKRNDLSI